jgi:hypothetical protein
MGAGKGSGGVTVAQPTGDNSAAIKRAGEAVAKLTSGKAASTALPSPSTGGIQSLVKAAPSAFQPTGPISWTPVWTPGSSATGTTGTNGKVGWTAGTAASPFSGINLAPIAQPAKSTLPASVAFTPAPIPVDTTKKVTQVDRLNSALKSGKFVGGGLLGALLAGTDPEEDDDVWRSNWTK